MYNLSISQIVDSTQLYKYDQLEWNKKKLNTFLGATGIVFTGSMIGLNQAWYAGYPKTTFHFANTHKVWLQMDKVGHVYSAYTQSLIFYRAIEGTGFQQKKALWTSAGFSVLFQSVIEIMDGHTQKWGASSTDILSNFIGTGLFLGQELKWKEQKLLLKWSFHPITYPEGQLQKRAHDLYGDKLYVTFLKDYNGQTYWLSGNINSLTSTHKLPNWLNLAIGYGAEQMYGGEENAWDDPATNTRIERLDIPRIRQYYLSLDADLTRIKTNSKFLKKALIALNILKVPFPALEINSQGKFKLHPMYF